MAAPDRQAATNITVCSVGGVSILAYLENGTYTEDTEHKEAKGVTDYYNYPWATGGNWKLEFDLFAGTNTQLMNNLGLSLPTSWTVGNTNYSGQALCTSGSHTAHTGDLQKVKITMMGQGVPTKG